EGPALGHVLDVGRRLHPFHQRRLEQVLGQQPLGPGAVAVPPPLGVEGDADVPGLGGGRRPVVHGVPADVADGDGPVGTVDLGDGRAARRSALVVRRHRRLPYFVRVIALRVTNPGNAG